MKKRRLSKNVRPYLVAYLVILCISVPSAVSACIDGGTAAPPVIVLTVLLGSFFLTLPVWVLMALFAPAYSARRRRRGQTQAQTAEPCGGASPETPPAEPVGTTKPPAREPRNDQELFYQALQTAIDERGLSTSMLQRRFRLGYAGAARLLDWMEAEQVIGPYNGSKLRVVLVERPRFPVTSPWDEILSTYTLPKENETKDGPAFERYCADLLEKNGFTAVEVTRASGDFGIDVLAEKDGITYAIQCKYYADKVGNHAVQEAFAGKEFYDRMVAAVMTNSTFTPAAIETARETHVLLWDGAKLAEMAGR